MALEDYRAKRDFTATPEPAGKQTAAGGNSFVIQKHAATRLHYDLRLELDGVLKSWAVTRGPSLVPGEKRLAVQVEDHPLDYGDFEGHIPKGQYGAGSVIVWDRGTWTPEGDPAKGLAKGHLEFDLAGEKLGGRWHLVRLKGKPGEKRENWLLIKSEDDAARGPDAPDILTERPESVKSGQSLDALARQNPDPKPARTRKAKTAALPDFVPPALATLKPKPPLGDAWLHEIKFDGYRLQARLDHGGVRLLTRNGHDWTTRFGARIAAAFAALPVQTALIDGELVVEGAGGASDFSALQADLSADRTDRFTFYGFDLLHLNGQDMTPLPLVDRRAALGNVLPADGPLRFSAHFDDPGGLVLEHACRLSLEGIVSKKKDTPYRSGRTGGWVKSKCSARQEFVVAGYVPSTTTKGAVGSLVLGLYDGGGEGDLRHVGRVGTGFTQSVAADLYRRLHGIEQDASPFAKGTDVGNEVRFVRPELVAEVDYRAWTAGGLVRHAAFRGLREDKDATSVVREDAPAKTTPEPAARRRVALTHPDRVYWPDQGITKEGLADYYAEVWRHIAPHIVGRPLALLRCPTGITGQQFFQKHLWKGAGKAITRIRDPKGGDDFVGVNDLDGLMALVQGAALEIHPWGASGGDLAHPDQITMDLDPGEGVGWQAMIDAAGEVRQRLDDAGLATFVKTSGGKGLHVVAPLKPSADWTAVKAFTKGLAQAMAADAPDRYVATIAKSARKGRILVDYLRNQYGATAVAAYSTRARPGAGVSAPLSWDEVPDLRAGDQFTLPNMPTRLAALGSDPWQDFRSSAAPLRTGRRKS